MGGCRICIPSCLLPAPRRWRSWWGLSSSSASRPGISITYEKRGNPHPRRRYLLPALSREGHHAEGGGGAGFPPPPLGGNLLGAASRHPEHRPRRIHRVGRPQWQREKHLVEDHCRGV